MAVTKFSDHILSGDHASLPAASSTPVDALYACTDHEKVYVSDGTSAWADWHSVDLSGLAASTHEHDADYAALVHNHDALYAAIAHNHDATYAALAHNHDADYADIAHTHTGLVPDPSAEADGRMLEVSSGALVYADAPSGGSGYAPDPSAQPDGKMLEVQSGAYAFVDAPSGGGGASTPLPSDAVVYTAGDITLSNTTWAAIAGPDDLVVEAAAGDVLAISMSCLWGNQTATAYVDMYTMVSGSPVNKVSGGDASTSDYGIAAWSAGQPSELVNAGGTFFYIVQAGDVSGGQVTLRLYGIRFTNNRTLYANTGHKLSMHVVNLSGAAGGGSTLPDGTADGQVLTWQDANVEVAKAWPGTPDLVSGLIDYARDNALAGTATWSSSYDSLATYDGNKAIDANTGTSWATNSPTGQWWQYDFGDGYGVKVTHWAIRQHSFDGYQPTEFTIQGSNDGSSWVTLYTHDGTFTATSTWQSDAVDAYSDTVFRYIKIVPTATKNGGNGVGFSEIEFWGTHVTIVQGQWAAEAAAGGGGAVTAADVSVADAGNYYPEEGTVVELRPDAILGSSGATGPVTNIDEAVLDTGDYIWLNNPNNYVTYSFGDCAGVVPEGATITRVRHVAYTAGQAGSDYRFRLGHASGNTAYVDIDRDAGGYAYSDWYDSTWWDASAWDTTKVDGINGTVQTDGYPDVYIYQAYLEVEYTTAQKTVEKALTAIGPGIVRTGTAFPDSPATGARYRRSDLGYQVFFYDGTRWLSEQEYSAVLWGENQSSTGGMNVISHAAVPSDDVWLTRYQATSIVVTTNNGSNYWTVALRKKSVADSATTIDSFSTSADTVANWTEHGATLGELLDVSSFPALNGYMTKTGSAGPINASITVFYRLIAT